MTYYKQLCETSLLNKVWEDIYRNKTVEKRKSSKGVDGVTLEAFKIKKDQYIKEISESLKTKNYVFCPTKISAIKKADGTPRMIAIQVVKDKIVQKTILSLINRKLYRFISNGVSYSGIKKNFWDKKEKAPNRIDAINKLIKHIKLKRRWIFETDIESFFDKIPKKQMLNKIFEKLHPDESLNKILEQIVNFEIANPEIYEKYDKEVPDKHLGVPQGSSLSPILANLYLFELDSYMKKRFKDRYIRYADDLIVVCKSESDAKKAKKSARYKIKKEALKLKEAKTSIINILQTPLIFLGVKFTRDHIIPKKTYGEIVKKWDSEVLNISNYKEVVRNGHDISKIDQMNEKIMGWAFGYKNFHVESMFKKLDGYLSKKKSDAREKLKGLSLIRDKVKIEPLIPIDEWKKLFSKKQRPKVV